MLATRNNVKDYMQIPRANATNDNLIDDFLTTAEADVLAWCKRPLEYEADRTKIFNGNGQPFLMVDLYPIAVDAELKIWISAATPRSFGDDELLDAAGYVVDHESGMIQRGGSFGGGLGASAGNWPRIIQSIKVQWSGGYWPADGGDKPDGQTIEDMPGNIRAAVEMIVADRLVRSNQLKGGQTQGTLTSEAISGQQSADYAEHEICEHSGFPKQAVAKLGAYRFSL